MSTVRVSRRVLLIAVSWLLGCGSGETGETGERSSTGEPTTDSEAPAGPCGAGQMPSARGGCCDAGELPLEDGRCLPAGTQENGCEAGQTPVGGGPFEGGTCRAAGVPPEMCGQGFEADGEGGCDPILPAEPCPEGMIAVPGEAECHDVAPCGDGKWGDIPIEPGSTVFVDQAYGGDLGPSDGTEAQPWTTIQDGIDAAGSGDMVAVAAGTYVEDIDIGGHVRLWGRCPALVDVVGTGVEQNAIYVKKFAKGTEIHGLSVRGDGLGVMVTGSKDVLLDRLWIHDTTGVGIAVLNDLGDTSVTLQASLVEEVQDVGVFVKASVVTVEATVVRRTQIGAFQEGGWGIGIQGDQQGARSDVTIRGSVVRENRSAGIVVVGSDAIVEETVVRETQPGLTNTAGGLGMIVQYDTQNAQRSSTTVRASVVERNRAAGVLIIGSDASFENFVVRETLPRTSDGGHGEGIVLEADEEIDLVGRTIVNVRTSLIQENHNLGVFVSGSELTMESTIVRRTQAQSSDQRFGRGIGIQQDPESGLRAEAVIRSCVLEENHDIGVFVAGSDALLDGTVVRKTLSKVLDMSTGRGVSTQIVSTSGGTGKLHIRSSLIEDSHDYGIFVPGFHALIEGTVVRRTLPDASNLAIGVGIGAQAHPLAIDRTSLVLVGSVIAENHGLGVFVAGADAVVEGTLVRDTLPTAGSHESGRGINVQLDPGTGEPASAALRGLVIEGSRDIGVLLADANATLDQSIIRDTEARASDGQFGDGVIVASISSQAVATITGCEVSGSVRAGVSSFGATVSIGGDTFECNFAHLNAQESGGFSSSFEKSNENWCGCGDDTVVCQVKSLEYEPPTPADVGILDEAVEGAE